MSLFLKYRPKCIEDVVGQKMTVDIIKNGLILNKLPHAFVFSGIRGTGKTTLARILSKALNCYNLGHDTYPCNSCDACLADNSIDIIEMDAASNTGVDDVRKIIETSQYVPSHLKYKVFIIDEVHMLSKSAFNALLKIIEEPPLHVKFIFATTEINKVPSTILSRCMEFELTPVKIDDMVNHLQKIANLEGVKFAIDALQVISRYSEGSVRDAISMLEQAILSVNNDEITLDDVNKVFMVDHAIVIDIFCAILRSDMMNLLASIRNAKNRCDCINIMHDLLDMFSFSIKIKAEISCGAKLSCASYCWNDDCFQLVQGADMVDLLRIWQMLLNGEQDIKMSFDSFAAFEIVLIRIMHLSFFMTPEDIVNKSQGNFCDSSARSGDGLSAGSKYENTQGNFYDSSARSGDGLSAGSRYENTQGNFYDSSARSGDGLSAGSKYENKNARDDIDIMQNNDLNSADICGDFVEYDGSKNINNKIRNSSFFDIINILKCARSPLLYSFILNNFYILYFGRSQIGFLYNSENFNVVADNIGELSKFLIDISNERWEFFGIDIKSIVFGGESVDIYRFLPCQLWNDNLLMKYDVQVENSHFSDKDVSNQETNQGIYDDNIKIVSAFSHEMHEIFYGSRVFYNGSKEVSFSNNMTKFILNKNFDFVNKLKKDSLLRCLYDNFDELRLVDISFL